MNPTRNVYVRTTGKHRVRAMVAGTRNDKAIAANPLYRLVGTIPNCSARRGVAFGIN